MSHTTQVTARPNGVVTIPMSTRPAISSVLYIRLRAPCQNYRFASCIFAYLVYIYGCLVQSKS